MRTLRNDSSDPRTTLVNIIAKVYSNITFKFRNEPYSSNDTCISFESKMKQVYDNVCIYSKRTSQWHLDYNMTKLNEIRPLIREAFTIWQRIPHDIRNGLGIAASMHLLSVTETNL